MSEDSRDPEYPEKNGTRVDKRNLFDVSLIRHKINIGLQET